MNRIGRDGRQEKYDSALQGALDSASGVDDIQRQIMEIQARQEEADKHAEYFQTNAREDQVSARDYREALGVQELKNQAGPGTKIYMGGENFIANPDGSVTPRPGSAEDYKRRRDAEEDAAAAAQSEQSTKSRIGNFDQVRGFVQGAKDAIEAGRSAGWWAVGQDIPESNALALKQALVPVMSGVALGEMERLKSQSAVGATGFGALSEKELAIISNARGSLEQKQKPEDLIRNLDLIDTHFKNFTALLNGEVPEGYKHMEMDGKV